MHKLRFFAMFLTSLVLPMVALADGTNAALEDPQVVPAPIIVTETGTGAGAAGQTPIVIGSNATGRPGVGPDQIYGYEANIAYDHVVVGLAVLGGIFLMTEWMENR